jgi:hypothetical protein
LGIPATSGSNRVKDQDDETIRSKAANDLENTPVAEIEGRLASGTVDPRYDLAS